MTDPELQLQRDENLDGVSLALVALLWVLLWIVLSWDWVCGLLNRIYCCCARMLRE